MRWLVLLAAGVLAAQTPDSNFESQSAAYEALKRRDYDAAIAAFQAAIAREPRHAGLRKDLAYTLLKTGETEAARDQFAEAMALEPADAHLAREYAYLCHETRQTRTARRVFDRLRKQGDAAAEEAYQNIDRPLAEGIARWTRAVELAPGNYSAHEELAKLAETRDEIATAALHYELAWKLRPEKRSLLLDLGRMQRELGREQEAFLTLLAASRAREPRTAELARELLPDRYPYVYEFRQALALDPGSVELRRELAYLHLEMKQMDLAEAEFEHLLKLAPQDRLSLAQLGFLKLARKDYSGAKPLLERVLETGDDEIADRVREALGMPRTLRRRDAPRRDVTEEARTMAARSLEKGYIPDAVKYLRIAHESDPVDFDVMLKLGWAYNVLKQDEEAAKWFRLAGRSPDPEIARPASRAYSGLRPGQSRVRTTAWVFPFFSSRWHNVFAYGQVKAEFRLGKLPLRPYLSVRLIGDTRGELAPVAAGLPAQYLSESSFIFAIGVATPVKRGFFAWAEAGQAMRYIQRGDVGRSVPDYRGGISYTKGFGNMLNGESRGWFAETNEDLVYVSRFQHDVLLYSQNRGGYTLPSAGGFESQVFVHANATVDLKQQYWGNLVEAGPGIRFRLPGALHPVLFSASLLRGAFLKNIGNPGRPNYWDARVGLWYAFTR